jgi:hypothetical protein
LKVSCLHGKFFFNTTDGELYFSWLTAKRVAGIEGDHFFGGQGFSGHDFNNPNLFNFIVKKFQANRCSFSLVGMMSTLSPGRERFPFKIIIIAFILHRNQTFK